MSIAASAAACTILGVHDDDSRLQRRGSRARIMIRYAIQAVFEEKHSE